MEWFMLYTTCLFPFAAGFYIQRLLNWNKQVVSTLLSVQLALP